MKLGRLAIHSDSAAGMMRPAVHEAVADLAFLSAVLSMRHVVQLIFLTAVLIGHVVHPAILSAVLGEDVVHPIILSAAVPVAVLEAHAAALRDAAAFQEGQLRKILLSLQMKNLWSTPPTQLTLMYYNNLRSRTRNSLTISL